MENEDAIAAEARDKAGLSGRRGQEDPRLEIESSQSPTPDGSPIRNSRSEDEELPLLGGKSVRRRTTTAEEEQERYQRAINEPWRGAQGSEGLPWYKKPSVSSCRQDGIGC
jgi:hypothetical protein